MNLFKKGFSIKFQVKILILKRSIVDSNTVEANPVRRVTLLPIIKK
jgi:hypothetical protein